MEMDKSFLKSHGIAAQLQIQLFKLPTPATAAIATATAMAESEPEKKETGVKLKCNILKDSDGHRMEKRKNKIPHEPGEKYSRKHEGDKELLISHGITSHARIHIVRLEEPVPVQLINTICTRRVTKSSYKKRVRAKSQLHKCPVSACDVQLSAGFLKNHLNAKHRSENLLKCPFPECYFSTWVSHFLKTHLASVHHQLPFHCSVCPKKCKSASNIRTHMLSHSAAEEFKQYVCPRPNCTYACHYPGSLKTHLRSHDMELKYKCPHCSWRTKYENSIPVHVEKTHGNSTAPKAFKCPQDQCNFVADKLSKVKLHSRVHSDLRPFKCHLCKFSTKHRTSITSHLVVHSGLKKFECYLCRKKIRTSQNLQDHVRRHLGEKPFKCPQSACHYAAATRSEIKIHVNQHHSDSEDGAIRIKSFSCPLCTKAFHAKKHLTSHITTHTLEKPFSCSFCSREFGAAGSKTSHEKCCRKRPGGIIKLYKCEFCDKRFLRTSHESLHKMTCKSRPDGRIFQPFKCLVEGCSFAATQKCNLKHHYNRIHSQIPP